MLKFTQLKKIIMFLTIDIFNNYGRNDQWIILLIIKYIDINYKYKIRLLKNNSFLKGDECFH